MGVSADRAFEQRSMKAQMKVADRSGAEIALIVGSDELASESIVMRLMATGEQSKIERSMVIQAVQMALSRMDSK